MSLKVDSTLSELRSDGSFSGPTYDAQLTPVKRLAVKLGNFVIVISSSRVPSAEPPPPPPLPKSMRASLAHPLWSGGALSYTRELVAPARPVGPEQTRSDRSPLDKQPGGSGGGAT